MEDSIVEVEEKFGSLEISLVERLSKCQKNVIRVLITRDPDPNENDDSEEQINAKKGAIDMLNSIIDKKNGIIGDLTKKNIQLVVDINKKSEKIIQITNEIKRNKPHSVRNEKTSTVEIVKQQKGHLPTSDTSKNQKKSFADERKSISKTDSFLPADDKKDTIVYRQASYTNPWCPKCKKAMSIKSRYIECRWCNSVVHPEFTDLPACCKNSLQISKRAFVCKVCSRTTEDGQFEYLSHISSNREDRISWIKDIQPEMFSAGSSSKTDSPTENDKCQYLDVSNLQLPSIDLSNGIENSDFTNISCFLSTLNIKLECPISQLEELLKHLQVFVEQLSTFQKDVIKGLVLLQGEVGKEEKEGKSGLKQKAVDLLISIIDMKNDIISKLRRKNVELLNEVNRKVEELLNVSGEMEKHKNVSGISVPGSGEDMSDNRGKQILSLIYNAVNDFSIYLNQSKVHDDNATTSNQLTGETPSLEEIDAGPSSKREVDKGKSNDGTSSVSYELTLPSSSSTTESCNMITLPSSSSTTESCNMIAKGSVEKLETPDLCPQCKTSITLESLQCKQCKNFVHYACTNLPEYCLQSLKTKAIYICETCVSSSNNLTLQSSSLLTTANDKTSCPNDKTTNDKNEAEISINIHQTVFDLERRFDSLEMNVEQLHKCQKEVVKFLMHNYGQREDRKYKQILDTENFALELLNNTMGRKDDILGELAKKNVELIAEISKNYDFVNNTEKQESTEGYEALIASLRGQNDVLAFISEKNNPLLSELQNK